MTFEEYPLRIPNIKSIEKKVNSIIEQLKNVKSKEEEGLVYWIKRDYEHEQMAYNMLLACKFVPMQTNNLALEKENLKSEVKELKKQINK